MRQRDTTQQSRFKDAPWFPKNNEICMVGGAGGIGSQVITAPNNSNIVGGGDELLED